MKIINSFLHKIDDAKVHADDQPALEKYVVAKGIAASSYTKPKKDSLYKVTLEDGRKVIAKWRGQRDLAKHSAVNLIKVTASTGSVRYYMYVSEVDGIMLTPDSALYRKVVKSMKTKNNEEIATMVCEEVRNLGEIKELLSELANSQPTRRVTRITKSFMRNSKIKELVKEASKYICEVCARKPFVQENGQFYAEADHIEPLGLGGLDTPGNMRCLCAQCHRVITYGSKETIADLLNTRKK